MFWCFFFSLFIYLLTHSLTHSSKLKLDKRKREKNETDYQYNTNSKRRRRRRRKRPTGITSLSVGKRLNKRLPLSDLIYTYTCRCKHKRVCVRSVCIWMYICASKKGIMIIVISYQSLAASIIWMIKSRKEEKNYNIFFVVRRKREERSDGWGTSLLFSLL